MAEEVVEGGLPDLVGEAVRTVGRGRGLKEKKGDLYTAAAATINKVAAADNGIRPPMY